MAVLCLLEQNHDSVVVNEPWESVAINHLEKLQPLLISIGRGRCQLA